MADVALLRRLPEEDKLWQTPLVKSRLLAHNRLLPLSRLLPGNRFFRTSNGTSVTETRIEYVSVSFTVIVSDKLATAMPLFWENPSV